MWCQTVDPFVKLPSKHKINLLGSITSLLSAFHPQTNEENWRLNQELEAALWCIASQNNSSCSSQLLWVQYDYNSTVCCAASLSPFQCINVHMAVNHRCFYHKRRFLSHMSWPSLSAIIEHGCELSILCHPVGCSSVTSNRCCTPAPTCWECVVLHLRFASPFGFCSRSTFTIHMVPEEMWLQLTNHLSKPVQNNLKHHHLPLSDPLLLVG